MCNLKDFVDRVYSGSLSESPFSYEELCSLKWLERQTHTRTTCANMLVGEDEGGFLKAFTLEILKQSRESFSIMEIGTFTGYSLLCFAFALKGNPNCKIEAIEINDELKYLIDEAVAKGNVADCVNVYFGDALNLESLPHALKKYDIVFIDANKRNYPEYYNLVFPIVKKGGFIVADNVNWHGKANDAYTKKDSKSEGIIKFNSLVESDSKKGLVESYLLPIRDGLYIIKKMQE